MGSSAVSNPSSSKHRKNTSEERRKKKKKIKTTKLKKRRHDSSSSSLGSGYSSSDSEEDDYRAPRKSSRRDSKRVRLSRDEDSSRHRQTRKKSRGRDQGKREKMRRRRRHDSISSTSSYSSRSCSTCRGRSSSPDGSGLERSRRSGRRVPKAKLSRRDRSRGRKKERVSSRISREVVHKRDNTKYHHRSLSCSSCSRCSPSRSIRSGSHHSSEGLAKKNNLKPRQSASKGTEKSKETLRRYQIGEDGNREEIIQDYDDLPSSRSNGSYDGVKKRESELASLASHPHGLGNKRFVEDGSVKRRADDLHREEVTSANVIQLAENAFDGDRYDLVHEIQSDNAPPIRLKSKISVPTSSPEADDLELVLRQKALENFRKFHCEPSATTKSLGDFRHDSTHMEPCCAGTDESLMHPTATPVVIPVKKIAPKSPCSAGVQKTDEGLMHPSAKPVVIPMKKNTKFLEHQRAAHDGSYPTDLKDKSVANRPPQIPTIEPMQKNHANKLDVCSNDEISSKAVVDKVVSGRDHSSHKYQDAPNQIQILKESSGKKLLEKTPLVKAMLDDKSVTNSGSNITYKVDVNKAEGSSSSASHINSKIGEGNSNEPKLEGKTGSEFEKKTMSVMRGGEMVQVSYKVYIPKKTPALARRQLQR